MTLKRNRKLLNFGLILTTMLLVITQSVLIVAGQSQNKWVILQTANNPLIVEDHHRLSNAGHIAQVEPFLEVYNQSGNLLLERLYRPITTQWLGNTIVFEVTPFFDALEPRPTCSNNEIPFGVYHVQNNLIEDFCVSYPSGASDLVIYEDLYRSPFDPYSLFANNQYLIDLQTNSISDLNGTFPTQIAIIDIVNWFGHDSYWWSPTTQQPVAKLQLDYTFDAAGAIEQVNIQICSIDNNSCEIIVPVHQILSVSTEFIQDVIVSPDGQNLLWTVATYLPNEPIRRDLIENILAFETNISTGQTVQIFSMSNYGIGAANGFYGLWSRDGRTLGVGYGDVPIEDPNRGTLIVTFTTPDYPATLSGTVWEDVNSDGVQNDGGGAAQQGRTVNLYDSSGQFLESTLTDVNGQYTFTIEAGLIYHVDIDMPANYQYSLYNIGSDDTLDSDINPITGLSDNIVVVHNQTDDRWDIGISEMGIVSCTPTVTAGDIIGLINEINTGNAAGSPYTICLENSTYSFNASDNSNGLGANALPVITGDIKIVGNGAILERDVSASNFRFLRVASGASLSLDNLTLQNGDSSGDGGAIYNEGTVNLDTVTVQDNQAAYEGGGIYNDGTVTVTDSSFLGNDAVNDDGGAIDNHGTLTISGSLFENNHSQGDDGGAIWTDSNTTVNISNSTFTLNSADDEGGAIMSFGTITITGETSFLNNTATTAGGAISADTGSISMTGGDFTGNTATNDDGGAIISFAPVSLNNVTLDDNTSGDKGGAIYVAGTSLIIENGSVLSNNDAGHNGGAIYTSSSSGSVTISDSTLSLNSTPQHGGALYLQNGTHVISNTIFDQNSSVKRGGAIYTDSTLTIQANSQFTSNQASDDGGAIYANGTINIIDSTFTLNSASDQGGVFRGFVSGSSSLTYSCIFSNSAGNTSGVYSASSNFDATNNWWGATDGPSGDGNGSGDAVNWGVDFANFVTTNCADAYQQGGTSSLVQNSSSSNIQSQAALADNSSFTTERSPYSDNFDAENALWFTASPRWLQSDTTSVSGSAWFIDTSVRGQSSVLEMTSWIELRNRNRIRLVYSEQAELASSDVVTLEIQTEGSSEWTVIAQNLGGSYTWREQSIDLIDYRRQTIRLRWRVDVPADEPVGENSQYYAIDDLEITHRRR